jgi:hypothetical protein
MTSAGERLAKMAVKISSSHKLSVANPYKLRIRDKTISRSGVMSFPCTVLITYYPVGRGLFGVSELRVSVAKELSNSSGSKRVGTRNNFLS